MDAETLKRQRRRRWRRLKRRLLSPFVFVLHLFEATFFFVAMAVFGAMSVERASRIGGNIARRFGPKLGVHKVGVDQLLAVMPGMTRDEAEEITRRVWENLGRTGAEYAHLIQLSRSDAIEIVGIETAKRAAAGGAIVFVSGHFANWETLLISLKRAGFDGTMVYRTANNRFVDWFVQRRRSRYGFSAFVPKGVEGTRDLLRTLREGKALAMLVDQKLNRGPLVPFLGRPANTSTGPALMALRSRAPVLPVSVERLDGPRFRVTMHEPLTVQPSGDRDSDVMALTVAINDFLGEQIRARPHEWLWLHRRWPKPKRAKN